MEFNFEQPDVDMQMFHCKWNVWNAKPTEQLIATCFVQEFVQSLSTLLRGTMEEKLRWTFSLYDINGDGLITIEEMTDIATAIYELMGRNPEIPTDALDPDQIKEKVEKIFLVSVQKFNTVRCSVSVSVNDTNEWYH